LSPLSSFACGAGAAAPGAEGGATEGFSVGAAGALPGEVG